MLSKTSTSSWILALLVLCSIYLEPRVSAASLKTYLPLFAVRRDRSPIDLATWAHNEREKLSHTSGSTAHSATTNRLKKRANGTASITNVEADTRLYASVLIGTPPTPFNMILDTHSPDIWVLDSECSAACPAGVDTFDTSSSSSFSALEDPFSIVYGIYRARGVWGRDTIQMAGFERENQSFARVDRVDEGILRGPTSGSFGLGWQSASASQVKPFWQELVDEGRWDDPVMAFHMIRVGGRSIVSPGGSFAMGALNESLYDGDVDYVSIPSGADNWAIPIVSISVDGEEVRLPSSGSSSLAVVVTSTPLIGGPSGAVEAFWDQIPGSFPGEDELEGFYILPCESQHTVEFDFGGQQTWKMSPDDIQFGRIDDVCVGSVVTTTRDPSEPAWIMGVPFLKNVYSIFRFEPPSVGFASLSSFALAQNEVDSAVEDPDPSPSAPSTSNEPSLVPIPPAISPTPEDGSESSEGIDGLNNAYALRACDGGFTLLFWLLFFFGVGGLEWL